MPKESINGFDMSYEVAGSGHPVAFIHGGFGGMGSTLVRTKYPWRDQFAEHYRVVTYDRRSAGASAYPTDGHSLENLAKDLRELLRHLGAEQSHIIGSSAGGPIALTYALAYPETAKALVLVNTSPRLIAEGRATEAMQERVDLLEREGEEAAYKARRSRGPAGLEALMRARAATATPDQIAMFRERGEQIQRLAKQTSREDRIRWYAGETRNYSAYVGCDLTERLAALSMPTFIIHGDADSVVPVAGAHKLHDGIGGSELRILAGAEHGLMAGNADAPPAILEFLQRVDR